MSAPPGRLTLITGPSGVGKGTLVQRLLAHHPEIGRASCRERVCQYV